MRKLIAATTLMLFGAAPAFGGEGCTYMDDAKADGGTPALVGAAEPEASKVQPIAFTKTQTPVKKQVANKPKTAAPGQKLAVNATQ
jgi:hypothetical protein